MLNTFENVSFDEMLHTNLTIDLILTFTLEGVINFVYFKIIVHLTIQIVRYSVGCYKKVDIRLPSLKYINILHYTS